jgi:hypothetical protein
MESPVAWVCKENTVWLYLLQNQTLCDCLDSLGTGIVITAMYWKHDLIKTVKKNSLKNDNVGLLLTCLPVVTWQAATIFTRYSPAPLVALFFIPRANQALISYIGLLPPDRVMFFYILDSQLLLQPWRLQTSKSTLNRFFGLSWHFTAVAYRGGVWGVLPPRPPAGPAVSHPLAPPAT